MRANFLAASFATQASRPAFCIATANSATSRRPSLSASKLRKSSRKSASSLRGSCEATFKSITSSSALVRWKFTKQSNCSGANIRCGGASGDSCNHGCAMTCLMLGRACSLKVNIRPINCLAPAKSGLHHVFTTSGPAFCLRRYSSNCGRESSLGGAKGYMYGSRPEVGVLNHKGFLHMRPNRQQPKDHTSHLYVELWRKTSGAMVWMDPVPFLERWLSPSAAGKSSAKPTSMMMASGGSMVPSMTFSSLRSRCMTPLPWQ
mmetsp:Transcript_98948/g.258508  ORF Transcript_98948/g.258508 Transcript_98948/m.258508 type:complete len:261 (+) Transcript_98948:490-1272(+)